MWAQLKPAIVLLTLSILLTGVFYPLAVTGIGQLIFPYQANGSLVLVNGEPRGSALIGQTFTDPKYFWGRPSATSPIPYNAAASSGSNLGPLSRALIEAVQQRVDVLRAADSTQTASIPVDLVTASASGLDPHISLAAAYYQIPRVAQARGLSQAEVKALVDRYVEWPQLGFLGEARLNVLLLNLALDGIK